MRGSKTTTNGRVRGGAKIPKSKHKKRQLDQRARWIIREWNRHPTLSYDESVDAIRERFLVGYSAGENACARANEMLSEMTIDQNTVERYHQRLANIVAAAFADKKYHAAIRGVMAQAELGGLLDRAPEVNINNILQYQHLQAIAMTPTQRKQRAKQLLDTAQLRAMQAGAIEMTVKDPIGHIVDEDFVVPIGGSADDEE